jgi:putative ABC transport system permease protein
MYLVGEPATITACTRLGGAAIILAAIQLGLLVGWCHTVSAIVRHADADVWVMAEQIPVFDFGTAIPRQRVYQARSGEGVVGAEGLFVASNIWRPADGRLNRWETS